MEEIYEYNLHNGMMVVETVWSSNLTDALPQFTRVGNNDCRIMHTFYGMAVIETQGAEYGVTWQRI